MTKMNLVHIFVSKIIVPVEPFLPRKIHGDLSWCTMNKSIRSYKKKSHATTKYVSMEIQKQKNEVNKAPNNS